MNKIAKDYRDLAIEAMEVCRKEMLKEFFELNTKAIDRLRYLSKTGLDQEASIRLENVRVDEWEEERYKTVSKWDVLKLRKKLKELDEDNLEFDIDYTSWESEIEELEKMFELQEDIKTSNLVLKEMGLFSDKIRERMKKFSDKN